MTKKLLLVVLFVAIVALSGLILPFQDRPPSKKTGVQFEYTDLDEPPIGATLNGAEFGDDDVARIAAIPSLRRIVLAKSRVTRRGLDSLSALKHLQILDLSYTSLTGDAIDAVVGFPKLKELRLVGCSWLKDDHLARLAALKSLERLELSSSSVTPTGLAHLSQVPSLRELTLPYCPAVDDEAIEALGGLSQLKRLTLSGTELTSRGYGDLCQRLSGVKLNVLTCSLKDLREISQRGKVRVDSSGKVRGFDQATNRDGSVKQLLPGDMTLIGSYKELSSLSLHGEITDKMLFELGDLPRLESLALKGTLVTDNGLKCLTGFPSLKRLMIYGGQIEGSGLKYLAHTPGLTYFIVNTREGNGVLEHLLPLQDLDELQLRAPITDDELSRMPVLAKLRSVWFSDSHVRGLGIESLSRQPRLVRVTLINSLVDDASIEHIAKLTSLPLSLRETRMTSEGKARLRELCPTLGVD